MGNREPLRRSGTEQDFLRRKSGPVGFRMEAFEVGYADRANLIRSRAFTNPDGLLMKNPNYLKKSNKDWERILEEADRRAFKAVPIC
jgi:hypothetical protein